MAHPEQYADNLQRPAPVAEPLTPPSATTPPAAVDTPPPAPRLEVPRTRTSAAYWGIAIGLVVFVVVLVFIIQNLHDASVHFFTLDFRLPLGLVILAAAVAGGLLVLIASGARVLQLRLMARRHRSGHLPA